MMIIITTFNSNTNSGVNIIAYAGIYVNKNISKSVGNFSDYENVTKVCTRKVQFI